MCPSLATEKEDKANLSEIAYSSEEQKAMAVLAADDIVCAVQVSEHSLTYTASVVIPKIFMLIFYFI